MPNQGIDQLNITISAGQKQKFKQWCGDQGTTITEVIRSLIDYCLKGELPEFLVLGDNPVIGRPNLDIDEVVNRVVERLSSNNLNQVPQGLSLGERVEKLEKLVNEVLSGTRVNQPDLDLIQRIENVEEWVNKLDKSLSRHDLNQSNLNIEKQKIEIGEEVLSNNLEQLNLESTENQIEDVLPSDNLFQLNLDLKKEKQEIGEGESFDDLSSQGSKERNNSLDSELLPSVVEVSASSNNDHSYEDTEKEITRLLNQNPSMRNRHIALYLEKNKFPTIRGKYNWQIIQVDRIRKKIGLGK